MFSWTRSEIYSYHERCAIDAINIRKCGTVLVQLWFEWCSAINALRKPSLTTTWMIIIDKANDFSTLRAKALIYSHTSFYRTLTNLQVTLSLHVFPNVASYSLYCIGDKRLDLRSSSTYVHLVRACGYLLPADQPLWLHRHSATFHFISHLDMFTTVSRNTKART